MPITVLVTGAAGFLGMLVSARLLRDGHAVVGVDNLNDYYTPALKQARLETLAGESRFAFERLDIADGHGLSRVFAAHQPTRVIHLAAQAGVRYALDNPYAYASSNLAGTTAVLESCRQYGIEHLVLASSSSVYGGCREAPFKESMPVDHPVSFYAATKRSNELMAHSYAHLFGLRISALRYFTVYGPWGRPDMAIWKFTSALLEDRPIEVFGHGLLSRDFTYGEDCAEATIRVLARPPTQAGSADPARWLATTPHTSWAPFEVYNVGRSDPVSVNELIGLLERITGRDARREDVGMQPGDVERTYADPDKLRRVTGYEPTVSLAEGLARFVDWYRAYHRIG